VSVEGTEDQGTTGNFEITLNGKLIHSKKHQGHGFLASNPEQQEVVFAAIEAALKEQ
jgi:selT/selW/selH-like putative selenoprotein